jgi:Ni,Fe-hydrogenase I cytochrome b subunit
MIYSFFTQLAALITSSEINFNGPKSEGNIMNGILMTAYFWAAVLAVVVIIVAGFFYATSQGDQGRVTRAKNAILGAVVGLVLILVAFVITRIVLGAFK